MNLLQSIFTPPSLGRLGLLGVFSPVLPFLTPLPSSSAPPQTQQRCSFPTSFAAVLRFFFISQMSDCVHLAVDLTAILCKACCTWLMDVLVPFLNLGDSFPCFSLCSLSLLPPLPSPESLIMPSSFLSPLPFFRQILLCGLG